MKTFELINFLSDLQKGLLFLKEKATFVQLYFEYIYTSKTGSYYIQIQDSYNMDFFKNKTGLVGVVNINTRYLENQDITGQIMEKLREWGFGNYMIHNHSNYYFFKKELILENPLYLFGEEFFDIKYFSTDEKEFFADLSKQRWDITLNLFFENSEEKAKFFEINEPLFNNMLRYVVKNFYNSSSIDFESFSKNIFGRRIREEEILPVLCD